MGLATLTIPVVGSTKQYTYLISLSLMPLWDSLSIGLATLTTPVVGSTSNTSVPCTYGNKDVLTQYPSCRRANAFGDVLHCKKVGFFPVPSRDVPNQTLPGWEYSAVDGKISNLFLQCTM
jgi:hypothetical protein